MADLADGFPFVLDGVRYNFVYTSLRAVGEPRLVGRHIGTGQPQDNVQPNTRHSIDVGERAPGVYLHGSDDVI